ncbi:hypothetical protein GQ44DRAFT_779383 [Phaeosphaeriaceae sp. PMI808]|nr:hypothetical protein GQ44DRAFT_779383 [Phaeosphaeriaceae sp. PMI808]
MPVRRAALQHRPCAEASHDADGATPLSHAVAREDDGYLQELKQLHEYVKLQIIKDIAVQGNSPDALEKWLGDHPIAPEDSDENRQATADLQATLEKLKLEREETELSVGDGIKSVAEREVKLRNTFELQRKRLRETHPTTLRTITVLYNVLSYQSKIKEAGELHQTVLSQRQAQLPPDHVDLFESMIDDIYISSSLGRVQEANDYALAVSLNALDTFESQLGRYEEAVKIQEAALELYDRIHQDQIFSDGSEGDKFEAAAKLTESLPLRLRAVKPKEFFEVFHSLIDLAAGLDHRRQHEISEPILTNVVETCLEIHGKRKPHATHAVLEQLAAQYRLRRPEHLVTIKQKRNLATTLGKYGSWAQAGLLQEQVLNILEQSSPCDALELADVKTALCEALRSQEQVEKSEAYGREAVLTYRAMLGDDHQTTLNAERQLGLTLSFAAKSAEAIDLFQRRVASTVRSHGEIHVHTGKAVEDLCTALLRARQLDEGEVQVERLLHISSHVPEINDGMVSLARTSKLRARNCEANWTRRVVCALPRSSGKEGTPAVSRPDYVAAEPLAREVLAAAAADSKPARLAAAFLGYVCEQTDRNPNAVAHYRAATESTRRVLGDTADATLDLLADLLRATLAEGNMTEALELAGELLRRRELRGEYREDTIDTKKDLVFILPAAARRLRFMEVEHPEEREEACVLLEVLSESCSKQGRWNEAEGFGRRAMDFRLASLGIGEEATLQTMAALARVLVDAGKMDEADGMIDLMQETCQHVFNEGNDERNIPYPGRAYLRFKQGWLDEAVAL